MIRLGIQLRAVTAFVRALAPTPSLLDGGLAAGTAVWPFEHTPSGPKRGTLGGPHGFWEERRLGLASRWCLVGCGMSPLFGSGLSAGGFGVSFVLLYSLFPRNGG